MSDNAFENPTDLMNKAFSPKKGSSNQSGGMEHPHGKAILQGIETILGYAATGQQLIAFLQENDINIKILKGPHEGDFNPSMNTAYLYIPAGEETPSPRAALSYIKAARLAQQEQEENLKKPTFYLAQKDWADRSYNKLEDIILTQVKFGKELKHSAGLQEILDELLIIYNTDIVSEILDYLDKN
tara:strand:+ start:536 stop:1090 length:555 start_codon:yes stop_codon:yes gene_type:complete